MKIHLEKPFIFLLGSAMLLTACLAEAQRALLIPVPLPPPGTEQPSSDPAHNTPDPERWSKEDITLDEQFSTAKKETMAAYQIAIDECKKLPPADVHSCLDQARQEMEKEMSKIRTMFGMTN